MLTQSQATQELRRLMGLWRAENSRVTVEAAAINLDRMRWLTPLVAVLNAIHVAVFLYQLVFNPSDDETIQSWQLALLTAHLIMGLLMAGSAVLAHRLQHDSRTFKGQVLPRLVVVIGMAFSIAVVAIDQWITPNITPFLIVCMIAGLAIYLRPLVAAGLYAAAYVGYFFAMELTQANPAWLLSNRLNGAAACVLGWALSVLLWRKFTTITLQQQQLENANTDLQEKQRELERLTRLDGLTGLFNRNTFVELTKKELDRAQRQGTATAILLLDLDHFKRVNDTWGHPAGDAVLKHAAMIASTTVRSTDLVGRLGGEEFIVLLPGTSIEAARNLAEKIRMRLEGQAATWNDTRMAITVSIGIAGTTASEKQSFEVLYHDADKALYVAKQRGRNRVI
jgi:diguanylate cyclase (GGDEF)-like protein